MIISAIPYTGNKRKLWRQIEPLLPECKVFVDLFTGGGTMTLNMASKCGEVYGGDTLKPVVDIHTAISRDKDFYRNVEKVNQYYPSTKEGFLLLREHYNVDPSPAKLLNLLLRSNSNQCRFNKKGEFNMTYGERNHFNKERLLLHISTVKDHPVHIFNLDYRELIDICHCEEKGEEKNTLFYVDPPYTGTTATYNEGKNGWGDKEDKELLNNLLQLQQKGYKVTASNIFRNKGFINNTWIDFCNKYKEEFVVHYLNRNYNNSSFRKVMDDESNKTMEVLIVSK